MTQVNDKLCVEEKIKICRVLDYDKLSAGSLFDLANSTNFPASARLTASVSQHSKLRILPSKIGCAVTFDDSKSRDINAEGFKANNEDDNQGVYANKPDNQTIDHRFIIHKPTKKFNREKQTRAGKITRMSSICPNNSNPLPAVLCP